MTSDDTEAKAWRKRASDLGRSQMEAQAAADAAPRKYMRTPAPVIQTPTVRGKYFTVSDPGRPPKEKYFPLPDEDD